MKPRVVILRWPYIIKKSKCFGGFGWQQAQCVEMEEKIIDFISVLRRNGVRVSISEDLDALAAAQWVSLADRESFKNALRSSLIKSAPDIPTFNDLFDIYFSGLGEVLKRGMESVSEGLFPADQDMLEAIKGLIELLERGGFEAPELLRALLSADRGLIERLMRDAAQRAGSGAIQNTLQEGFFTRSLLNALGWGEVERSLEDLMSRLDGLGTPADQVEKIRRFLQRIAELFPQMARDFIRLEREKNNYKHLEKFREQNLSERSFAYLTEDEISSMQDVVQRLAERLKTRVTVRRKRAKHGRLDPKATLRKNLASGGVPFHLVLSKRKKTRPEIMALCDISDSVRNASRFMLQFVYTIQELFSKVRSFVFVADLGEITGLFEELDITEAIEKAWTGGPINAYTHSDYGFAFHIFREHFMPSVTNRTTVIIIGDGRNNYNDPKEWVLEELRKKARKIIWLNPEAPTSWGFGDSEMSRYMRYCDIVEECRNLKQLTAVIDRIVL